MSASPPDPGVTVLLRAAAEGDPGAASRLLPLLYDELRRLAEDRMRRSPAGNTLQPTALIHEAYLRLVGGGDPGWNSRGHFFGAAARAMRDILVEQARRKAAAKRGADRERVALEGVELTIETDGQDMVALDAALMRLEAHDADKARIVMLRYFAGLTAAQTAAALDLSERTVEREWRYIKAWLRRELEAPGGDRG